MEPDKPEEEEEEEAKPEEKKEEVKPEVKTEAKPKKHHTHHHYKTGVKKTDFWKTATIIFSVLFVLALVTKGFTVLGTDTISTSAKLSADEASSKAIKYINENLMQPGTTANLVNVTEMEALYNIKMSIGGREFESFITKDGQYLFPSGIDLDAPIEIPQPPEPPKPVEVPTTDTLQNEEPTAADSEKIEESGE